MHRLLRPIRILISGTSPTCVVRPCPQRRRCRRPRHPQRASLRRISTLAAAFSISVGSALVPAPRLRRDVLLLAPPAAAAALSAPSAFFASCLAAAPAPAGAAQTTAEAVRRAASILPGLGQPDVYYPPPLPWILEGDANRRLVGRPLPRPAPASRGILRGAIRLRGRGRIGRRW